MNVRKYKCHMTAVMMEESGMDGESAPTSPRSGSVSAPLPLHHALPPPLKSPEAEASAPGRRRSTREGSMRSSGSRDCRNREKAACSALSIA